MTREEAAKTIFRTCANCVHGASYDGTFTCDSKCFEAKTMAVLALQEPKIVRCKECKHFNYKANWCNNYNTSMCQSDYCSDYELRTVNRNDL